MTEDEEKESKEHAKEGMDVIKQALQAKTPQQKQAASAHAMRWLLYDRRILAGTIILGFLLYGTLAYLAITHIVLPIIIPIYDFTKAQADQIGVLVESEFLSAGAIGIIAYLLGKRAGKPEIDYEQLRKLLKEDREETIKALTNDTQDEDSGSRSKPSDSS